MTININPGTVLPVTTSSNGQLFAAYLPEIATAGLIDEELSRAAAAAPVPGRPRNRPELDVILRKARETGMTAMSGVVLRGISSISVPIFGHAGNLLATLTIVGLESVFDNSPIGTPAQALLRAGARLSERMGALPARPACRQACSARPRATRPSARPIRCKARPRLNRRAGDRT